VFLGKEQLEELKNMKKEKGPILTAEEKASKLNKQEIKGTGIKTYECNCFRVQHGHGVQ
jgi:hypothetical protein